MVEERVLHCCREPCSRACLAGLVQSFWALLDFGRQKNRSRTRGFAAACRPDRVPLQIPYSDL